MAVTTTTALVAGGLLGAASLQQGRMARREQRRASRIEQKRQRLASTRAAIDQVRQGQIARSQIIAQGELSGAADSSAVAGGAGAVQSQVGGNIAFQNQMYQLQAQAMQRLQKANDFSFRSNALGQLSQNASSMGSSSNPATDGTYGSRASDYSNISYNPAPRG